MQLVHAALHSRPSPIRARPGRVFVRVLVLLLAVLLPLRVWAMASMPIAPTGAAVVAHMPCHGAADQPVADGALPPLAEEAGQHPHDSHETATAGHLCEHCVLCHSALAVDAAPRLHGPAPATDGWQLAAARDTGRLLANTLERPPRA